MDVSATDVTPDRENISFLWRRLYIQPAAAVCSSLTHFPCANWLSFYRINCWCDGWREGGRGPASISPWLEGMARECCRQRRREGVGECFGRPGGKLRQSWVECTPCSTSLTRDPAVIVNNTNWTGEYWRNTCLMEIVKQTPSAWSCNGSIFTYTVHTATSCWRFVLWAIYMRPNTTMVHYLQASDM